jgi:hypothetical protein
MKLGGTMKTLLSIAMVGSTMYAFDYSIVLGVLVGLLAIVVSTVILAISEIRKSK